MNLDLKLTCPHCGKESHMAAFGIPEWADLARLSAKFGGAWPRVEQYLQSFRSQPDKPLKLSRTIIIATEILTLVQKGSITFDGQTHGVRSDAIYAACWEVALMNKTGFKNHNYLKKVAIGKNLQMIQAEEKQQNIKAMEARKRDPDAPEKIRNLINTIGG